MIVIRELMEAIRNEGYSGPAVGARVFQDLVLEAIASGPYSENITIKGGVLMRELSQSARRATMDIDMDFMRFPLTDEGILRFIDSLNVLEGISFKSLAKSRNLNSRTTKGNAFSLPLPTRKAHLFQAKSILASTKIYRLVRSLSALTYAAMRRAQPFLQILRNRSFRRNSNLCCDLGRPLPDTKTYSICITFLSASIPICYPSILKS